MTSASGPRVGGFATSTSSPAISIPQTNGCNRSCRRQVSSVDSNQQVYDGEGTRLGVGAPSYDSADSLSSVKESSDAPDPTAAKPITPSSYDMIRSVYGRQDSIGVAETKMDRFVNEPDDECPWRHFLEKSITSDASQDEPGFFGPIEVEGSMRNNTPVSSAEQSMLSSFMSSISPRTPRTPSVDMSEVICGVGGFSGPRGSVEPGHRYLRLN